jgi:hypothetical protein
MRHKGDRKGPHPALHHPRPYYDDCDDELLLSQQLLQFLRGVDRR